MSPKYINIEVDRNKLITTLISWIYLNPLIATLDNICARPPAPRVAWNHWIHAAGGVSGSITMVVVFVGCLCCCGWTCDVMSSLYVKNGTKNNLKTRLTHYFLIHVGMHHTYYFLTWKLWKTNMLCTFQNRNLVIAKKSFAPSKTRSR